MSRIKVIRIIAQIVVIFILLQLGNLISGWMRPIIFIPGSIMGMLVFLCLLLTGILQLEFMEETSAFLLRHMGFFFIPLGVGLIESMDLISEIWFKLVVLLIVSCAFVMFVSSKVTEIMIRLTEGKGES